MPKIELTKKEIGLIHSILSLYLESRKEFDEAGNPIYPFQKDREIAKLIKKIAKELYK